MDSWDCAFKDASAYVCAFYEIDRSLNSFRAVQRPHNSFHVIVCHVCVQLCQRGLAW